MASRKSPTDLIVPILSRRDLFRTVGLTAGGMMLAGLPGLIGRWTPEAEAALKAGSGLANLALELDGTISALGAAGGGNPIADIVPEQVGPDLIQRKRPGPVRFEDIQIDVLLNDPSKPLMSWITDTLSKGMQPKNGAIVYLNQNYDEVKRLEFSNGLLTEIALSSCNANDGKRKMIISLRIAPQSTRLAGGGKKIPLAGSKIRQILASNFRFNIQGLESACQHIVEVGGIDAKRLLLSSPAGQEKIRQITPGALDCSTISIKFPESDGAAFYKWFDEFAIRRNAGPGGERSGKLELLSLDLQTVLATVQFANLGIIRYAPEPMKAGQESLALVQVDLYCEGFSLALL